MEFIELPRQGKDITGKRYGRLVAIGPIGTNKQGVIWACQCDCGASMSVHGYLLRSGNTKSCGCLRVDTIVAIGTSHGLHDSPYYKRWLHITQRCVNPNDKNYANYGGRGISVYNKWRHDFAAFHNYISQLPDCGKEGYSLDRIDNNGNYEPGNLRWTTQDIQMRNTRSTRWITFGGKTLCVADWEKELNLPEGVLRKRLYRKWSVERALTTPLKVISDKSKNEAEEGTWSDMEEA